jgi:guanylate kinase
MQQNTGRLIVLTGFSGSGKDTLMNMILKKRPDISRVVTHTTRPKRYGEKDGVDYHFVRKGHFEKLIEGGKLVEHVMYGSHYKGTAKENFSKITEGENLIWRIDMSRAAIIEQTYTDTFGHEIGGLLINRTTKVLIRTSNPQVALNRYRKRDGGSADYEEFKRRLDQDFAIWKSHKKSFPHVIINRTGRQHEAVDKILRIIGD